MLELFVDNCLELWEKYAKEIITGLIGLMLGGSIKLYLGESNKNVNSGNNATQVVGENVKIDNYQWQNVSDNAQLVRGEIVNQSVTYNVGIDEKRAKEICIESFEQCKSTLVRESYEKACERVQSLTNTVIPKLVEEHLIDILSDPAAYIALVEAQKAAMATERQSDYEMLSELLIAHFKHGEKRKTRVGVKQAIRIISDIDDDALCALTVVHAVVSLSPTTGICLEGLKLLNEVVGNLMYMDLPSGKEWVEHLELLQTIRTNTFGGRMKSLVDYYSEQFCGYVSAGIRIDSDNYNKAVKLLEDVGLPLQTLVVNPLMEGYVLLPVVKKNAIREMAWTMKIDNGNVVAFNPSTLQYEALVAIWNLYDSDTEVRRMIIEKFTKKLDEYPNLNKLRLWWDALPCGFSLTSIGKVLAHTNARRCDQNIPELPIE